MSEATHETLIAALTAHIQDEDESAPIVTGLLLIAAVAGMDAESTGYRFEVLHQEQPAHVTRGLVSLVQEWAMDVTSLGMWNAAIGDDDDL